MQSLLKLKLVSCTSKAKDGGSLGFSVSCKNICPNQPTLVPPAPWLYQGAGWYRWPPDPPREPGSSASRVLLRHTALQKQPGSQRQGLSAEVTGQAQHKVTLKRGGCAGRARQSVQTYKRRFILTSSSHGRAENRQGKPLLTLNLPQIPSSS